jgi:hypothetical protein
MLKLIQ